MLSPMGCVYGSPGVGFCQAILRDSLEYSARGNAFERGKTKTVRPDYRLRSDRGSARIVRSHCMASGRPPIGRNHHGHRGVRAAFMAPLVLVFVRQSFEIRSNIAHAATPSNAARPKLSVLITACALTAGAQAV